MNNWQDTKIWKQLLNLESAEAEDVRTTLRVCMPLIQTTLANPGTGSADFTLHDAQHSFRVAERMVEIVPEDVFVKLTSYELALLLLSAYLHDIGMSPERKKVNNHYTYLLTGDKNLLSNNEWDLFQEWLDNRIQDVAVPICKAVPTIDDIAKAEELTAYYTRSKHNDWSSEWTREHFIRYELGTYKDWLDNLILLCRSHHYEYEELKKESYNPRVVDAAGKIVHLRYLACVLRVADVLECDPERTPAVLFKHRNIVTSSQVYWWKDHSIHPIIEKTKSGKQISIFSRPSSAVIHRAIEVTVAQIETELVLCRRLADETHFKKGPFLINDLPHYWELLSHIHADIKPKENTYEYIQGAFRPNTEKLLQLFAGEELYGTPFAAVRELLQNAFDAVKEQIAYERLQRDDASDPKWEKILSELHVVKLSINQSSDGVWLICKDDGVGMTKQIIENYLLVSGASRRHEILELERRCNARGFSTGRTGQFGIGVLSYFMLSDYIQILTRRSQESGQSETTGWYFQTQGVGDFGELRRDASLTKGSEIHLKLRTSVVGEDHKVWGQKLEKYISTCVLYSPCKVELSLVGPLTLKLPAGWCNSEEYYKEKSINSIAFRSTIEYTDLITRQRIDYFTQYEAYLEYTTTVAKASLRIETLEEGNLPGNIGSYKIVLPYFHLPGGISLAFIRIKQVDENLYIEQPPDTPNTTFEGEWTPDVVIPRGSFQIGWKGMATEMELPKEIFNQLGDDDEHTITRSLGFRNLRFTWGYFSNNYLGNDTSTLIEINLHAGSAKKISLNRENIVASVDVLNPLQWLDSRITELYHSFLAKHNISKYNLLNYRILGLKIPVYTELHWVTKCFKKDNTLLQWKGFNLPATLQVPVINYADTTTYLDQKIYRFKSKWTWKQEQVFILDNLKSEFNSSYIGLFHKNLLPDKIVWFAGELRTEDCGITCLWTSCTHYKHEGFISKSQFPPMWSTLLGISLKVEENQSGFTILNDKHSITLSLNAPAWDWCNSVFDEKRVNPLPYKNYILADRHKAAAWIIFFIQHSIFYKVANWLAIIEQDSNFLESLFNLLGYTEDNRFFLYWTNGYLVTFSPDDCKVSDKLEVIQGYLPLPGDEWTIFSEAI